MATKQSIPKLLSAVEQTLASRGNVHGEFADNAQTMQALKDVCKNSLNWETLHSVHKEAVDMICHKLGRILSGDPNHQDHWHDIQGYAKLVEDRLPLDLSKE